MKYQKAHNGKLIDYNSAAYVYFREHMSFFRRKPPMALVLLAPGQEIDNVNRTCSAHVSLSFFQNLSEWFAMPVFQDFTQGSCFPNVPRHNLFFGVFLCLLPYLLLGSRMPLTLIS